MTPKFMRPVEARDERLSTCEHEYADITLKYVFYKRYDSHYASIWSCHYHPPNGIIALPSGKDELDPFALRKWIIHHLADLGDPDAILMEIVLCRK